MKFKGSSLLVFFVLCFSWLSFTVFCSQGQQLTSQEAALVKTMKFPKEIKKEIPQSLAKQIIEDNNNLVRWFGEKKFLEMQTLLGKRGAMLVSHAYEKITGNHSALYWQEQWKENTELQFKITSVILSDAIGTQKVKRFAKDEIGVLSLEDVEYDISANVTYEFHVIQKQAGAEAHNQTGTGVSTYMHRTMCRCE